MEIKEKNKFSKIYEVVDEKLVKVVGGATQDQLALNQNEYGVGSIVWAYDTTNNIYRWGTVESIFDEEPEQAILTQVKFEGGFVLTSEGMKTLTENKSWVIVVYGAPFGADYV